MFLNYFVKAEKSALLKLSRYLLWSKFSSTSKTHFLKPKDVSETRYHGLFKTFYIIHFVVYLLGEKQANFSNFVLFFNT